MDLIDRAKAIDAIAKLIISIPTTGGKDLIDDVNRIRAEDISVIKRLPSVQPEIIRCRECKHYHFADNRIPQEQRYVCDIGTEIWEPDDYCSYAERREVDDEKQIR